MGAGRRRRRAGTLRRHLRRGVRAARPRWSSRSRRSSRSSARAGIAVLERTVAGAAAPAGALVLLDVKRGDIGSTMAAYAGPTSTRRRRWPPTRSPVSPTSASASLQPAFDAAGAHGGGVFVLALTSNPEGAAGAARPTRRRPRRWRRSVLDELAARNAGADAARARSAWSSARRSATPVTSTWPRCNGPFLVPGIGAQGGTADDVRRIFGTAARNVLPSVSREVLRHGPGRGRAARRRGGPDRRVRVPARLTRSHCKRASLCAGLGYVSSSGADRGLDVGRGGAAVRVQLDPGHDQRVGGAGCARPMDHDCCARPARCLPPHHGNRPDRGTAARPRAFRAGRPGHDRGCLPAPALDRSRPGGDDRVRLARAVARGLSAAGPAGGVGGRPPGCWCCSAGSPSRFMAAACSGLASEPLPASRRSGHLRLSARSPSLGRERGLRSVDAAQPDDRDGPDAVEAAFVVPESRHPFDLQRVDPIPLGTGELVNGDSDRSVPISTSASPAAIRLRYHCGCCGRPPAEANTYTVAGSSGSGR